MSGSFLKPAIDRFFLFALLALSAAFYSGCSAVSIDREYRFERDTGRSSDSSTSQSTNSSINGSTNTSFQGVTDPAEGTITASLCRENQAFFAGPQIYMTVLFPQQTEHVITVGPILIPILPFPLDWWSDPVGLTDSIALEILNPTDENWILSPAAMQIKSGNNNADVIAQHPSVDVWKWYDGAYDRAPFFVQKTGEIVLRRGLYQVFLKFSDPRSKYLSTFSLYLGPLQHGYTTLNPAPFTFHSKKKWDYHAVSPTRGAPPACQPQIEIFKRTHPHE